MIRSLFISLFATAVALLLAEVGVRFAASEVSNGLPLPGDRPSFYYKAREAKLFRDYPETFSEESQPRIAVVGDSFSFATSMQFDDAFPNKLERLMQREGFDSASVVNYGVPGYSTTHERDAVVQAVREGAQLVILQVTLNDTQRKAYRPSGLSGSHQFGPLVLRGVERKLADYWKTYSFVRNRIHNTQTHNNYVEYYHKLFYTKANWNPFKDSITAMKRYCEANRVQFVAVVFPLFGVPLDDSYPFHKIHKRVANLFSRKEVPALDLFPVFKRIPLDQIQVEPGVDFHPNEYGHRLAAEALYEWLRFDLKLASDEKPILAMLGNTE